MMRILRDEGSGICMCDGGFRSNGSQVRAGRALAGMLVWVGGARQPPALLAPDAGPSLALAA